MWRDCSRCEKRFFQGGTFHARNICSQCRYKTRQNSLKRTMAKRKYETITFLNHKGQIIKEKSNFPERICGFCDEFKPHKGTNQVSCDDCVAIRPENKKSIIKCSSCDEKFWGHKSNSIYTEIHKPYCSPMCKEMLREHHECITCGERITPERQLNAKFCKERCRILYDRVISLREDRDGKGNTFSPQHRYKILCELKVSETILKEFRRDINESKNNSSC